MLINKSVCTPVQVEQVSHQQQHSQQTEDTESGQQVVTPVLTPVLEDIRQNSEEDVSLCSLLSDNHINTSMLL